MTRTKLNQIRITQTRLAQTKPDKAGLKRSDSNNTYLDQNGLDKTNSVQNNPGQTFSD